MSLYTDLLAGREALSLVGLGYVGLPIAVAFSKKIKVVGFDISSEKISLYKSGIDPTHEVGDEGVANCNVLFTTDALELKDAKFHIIAVPTPVRADKTPDLTPIERASRTLGQNLTKGSIVVYESTVYPGVTEEFCVPILEKESGLKCGIDFKVGYSPERINPGDKVHRLDTIIKIVSGMDDETLDTVAKVYELVALSGVFRAKDIKTAESAKVIENCQRDINIAFINELALIFGKMGIDTEAVLKAAETKWNFLNFKPGLVGGHCIGVDPYYLTHAAERVGYHSQVILSGRKINDDMGKYIAEQTAKQLGKFGSLTREAKVAILGMTFKEDCPDIRNTRVVDIIYELREYGIEPLVADPLAVSEDVYQEYGISLTPIEQISGLDAVILAVSHKEYVVSAPKILEKLLRADGPRVCVDIKSICDADKLKASGYNYWRL